jgi:hypothetical protein
MLYNASSYLSFALGTATYKSSGILLRKLRLHQRSKYWDSAYSISKLLSGFPRNVAVTIYTKMCRNNQILDRIVPQQHWFPASKCPEFFIFSRLHNCMDQGFWHSYTHLQFRRSLCWLHCLWFLLALAGGSYKQEQMTSETNGLS